MSQLTSNGIELLFKEDQFDRIVLQVLEIQPLTSGYSVILSDGTQKTRCTLGSGLDIQIQSGLIKQYTIVKVSESSLNKAGQSVTPVILKWSPTSHPLSMIGNPQTRSNVLSSSQVRDSSLVTGNPVTSKITPISAISIYSENNWTIKGTCIRLGSVKTFNSKNGPGKVCDMDIADDSGEIRVTLFSEKVDKYFDILEEGKVYLISNGKVSHKNHKFNRTNHTCEITSTYATEISLSSDQDTIAKQHFDFTPINNIEFIPDDVPCDTIGKVTEIEDVQNIVSKKTGLPLVRRRILISDRSGPNSSRKDIYVTLWGDKAEKLTYNVGDVIALKRTSVNRYSNNLELSLSIYTQLICNPDVPEYSNLVEWDPSDEEKSTLSTQVATTSTYSYLFEGLSLSSLGEENKSAIVHAVIKRFLGSNVNEVMYQSCPSEKCGKKVIENDGSYYCPKCAAQFQTFKWSYNLTFSLADHSGGYFVTCFNDIAEKLFGKTAQELHEILSNGGEDTLSSFLGQFTNIPHEFGLRWSRRDEKDRYIVSIVRPISVKPTIQILLNQVRSQLNN